MTESEDPRIVPANELETGWYDPEFLKAKSISPDPEPPLSASEMMQQLRLPSLETNELVDTLEVLVRKYGAAAVKAAFDTVQEQIQ